MEQVLELFKRIFSVLLILLSISLIMAYEKMSEIIFERMEMEIIWNHLSNFGM